MSIMETLVSLVGAKLFAKAEEEFDMLLGVPNEIKKLTETLLGLQDYLVDAERRVFEEQFRESSIKSWLKQLREVEYEIDDILDEYKIRTNGSEPELLPPSRYSMQCFQPFFSCYSTFRLHHSVGNDIKKLKDKLKQVDGIKQDLNLTRGSSPSTSKASEDRGNSSQMPQIDPMGIDHITLTLVKRLLEVSREKNVLVYAIAGMGGIGKTTLAWEIFKHEMIQANFRDHQPVWVCVSRGYEKMALVKEIIQRFKGQPDNLHTLIELQDKLRQIITGKKFFLILDDVWEIEVWNLLEPCLSRGANGSRVFVTTRNKGIAEQMQAQYCHEVQILSPEDSWSLLCKMVFRDEDAREKQKLKNIGEKIVDKCSGLPLALKTIGGVLRGRDSTHAEWQKVAGDSAWSFQQPEDTDGIGEKVMGALHVSYEDLLHPELKKCFVYCSLFPEDHVLRQDILVPLWIAEGFIKVSKDSSMEDTAEKYWRVLVERSLLQADPGYHDQGGCRMHDVVRSFALHLALDEFFSGGVQGFLEQTTTAAASSLPKKRRVLIKDAEGVSIPDVIKEPTCLRTMIFLDTPLRGQVPEDFFEKFTYLRVLDLTGAANAKLPDAVQHLIHLRYLNLSRSQISEIPSTIGKLRYLQFLGLQDCEKLQILSEAIVNLRELRVLDVEGTPLEGMPQGIGNLRRLNRLVGFIVNGNANNVGSRGAKDSEGQDGRQQSSDRWCALKELKSLTQLRFLVIQNLERISVIDEAESAELSSKTSLDDLRLICNPHRQYTTDEEKDNIREVFNKLCPPSRLQRLKISGYFGLEYPAWMMGGSISSCLADLKHLDLIYCFLCQTLPPLGLLPHLETLHISRASAVISIGTEFLLGDDDAAVVRQPRHCSSAFPKLKNFTLRDMDRWEKWEHQATAPLPLLEELVIERCDRLISLPKGLLHNVSRLTIGDACNIGEIGNLPSLRTLHITHSGLVRIHNLPVLENLIVVDCYGLRNVEEIGELQYFKLQDQNMASLPDWWCNEKEGEGSQQLLTPEGLKSMFAGDSRQNFVVVRKLEIICSIQLLHRCIKNGPEWPKIQDIPFVKGYTMDKSRYISYDKSNPDSDFETNINEGDITSKRTEKSSSDLSLPSSSDLSLTSSIVILLLLIVGIARLAFEYKSFLLPFLLKAAFAIQKFK